MIIASFVRGSPTRGGNAFDTGRSAALMLEGAFQPRIFGTPPQVFERRPIERVARASRDAYRYEGCELKFESS